MSYRQLQEMMTERGVVVDHSSINRWAIWFLPLLKKVFQQHKRAVGTSWRMNETYNNVKGAWKYLYRAVDKEGSTIDFLLTARRDAAAARRFFDKAMRYNAVPNKITMDGSGANRAAIEQLNQERDIPVAIRQVKYLNNIVEQDHRAIKRIIWPMPGFQFFRCAHILLAGIETMHMIKKGQPSCPDGKVAFAVDRLYSLPA